MRKFICLGLATLDNTWFVPDIPTQPLKVLAEHYLCSGGGMAATAAVTIARLGAQVAFWGRRGDDLNGDAMAEQLRDEGVDIRHFRPFTGARSPVAAVLVDPYGERLISTYRGDGLPPEAHWLPLDTVAQSSAVLADMRWIDGAAALFKRARRDKVPCVLDADLADAGEYRELLPLTDHAIFSATGLAAFAPDQSQDQALLAAARYGCRVCAVSNGEHGIRWHDASGFHHTAAFAVDAVDTTGAGDIFHGAYAWAIGHDHTPADAMTFAAACAALACRQRGARSGIPSLSQVQQLLDPPHARIH